MLTLITKNFTVIISWQRSQVLDPASIHITKNTSYHNHCSPSIKPQVVILKMITIGFITDREILNHKKKKKSVNYFWQNISTEITALTVKNRAIGSKVTHVLDDKVD